MRTVVGVLRGGTFDYDNSLKSGAAVLEHIDKEKFEPRDIFIDRTGLWHVHGLAVDPAKALFGVDVAFNALHDSAVGRYLEGLSIPHTGPGVLAANLLADTARLKHAAKNAGVPTPYGMHVARGEPTALAHQLFRTFPQPSVVAGNAAHHFGDFHTHLANAFLTAEKIYIEEHIAGRPAQVGIIANYRNEPYYALIPTPVDLPTPQKDAVAAFAKKVHQALGLGAYSHAEFVVGKRGPYFVGVSAHPPLHSESGFVESLRAVGSSLKEFISHVIQQAKR